MPPTRVYQIKTLPLLPDLQLKYNRQTYMKTTVITPKWQAAMLCCAMWLVALCAQASLQADGEYYIWLNIYEKVLGNNSAEDAPALSTFGIKTDADSYVFVAEASGSDGYVLLRQKSSGRYLAVSSANSYSVVYESGRSTDARFCWKVDAGTYTYLVNKKTNGYLGVDGANKSSTYVSVYGDKPKGSHSQFSVIPTTGGTWAEARREYESEVYTNAQGVREIDYCQLNNRQIDRSDAIDIHVTANTLPIGGTATVNLGSEQTWLVIDNIVPSTVTKSYLKYVKIKGVAAKNGTNCRVAIFLNGAAVIPLPDSPMSCSGTNGDFTLSVGNHADLGTQSNAMTSFVLRRGYMATLATGTDGTGYSRVYVADHADLTITLPTALTKRVTSVNLKEWQYLSKKGWGNTGGSAGADKLRATWFWSWSAGYSSTADFEFVPCRQHLYWPSASAVNSKTASASMSLNEPEHSEQHDNCACGGTIDAWRAYGLSTDFLAGGGRIGSPQPTDLSYLKTFCEYVDNNAKRCDFTVTHSYWDLASYDETSYANWFCNTQCKSVWNNTGRPVWLSEMEISASWNTNKVTSYEQNRKYLQVLLQKIDECPWIERYAIYGTDMYQTYMFYNANTSSGLTPAGEVYRDHRATFAYNASYTKVPTWWAPSVKTPTLAYTIDGAGNAIVFTLGNANGDAAATLELQQLVDGTWQPVYSVTDRSLLEQSELTHTVSLDDLDIEEASFRVATTTLYGGSATSDEVQTGFIQNPGITATSKSNVPGWTCVRNAQNGFTKADTGDTYLEAWGPVASQMDFNYYQDLTDLPGGVYTLSAVCFNSSNDEEGASVGGSVGLYAVADGVNYFAPVTTDGEIDYDHPLSIAQIVVRNGTMRIGIRNIAPMTARWAGADNFKLRYLGTEAEVLNTEYKALTATAEQDFVAHLPALGNGLWDATSLIGNADCSRGTTDFWTVSNLETKNGEAYDGKSDNNYFNIWKSGAYTSSIQQTLDNLPAGKYTLSALLRGTSGLDLTLQADLTEEGDAQSKTLSAKAAGTGTTAASSDYQNGWQKVQLEEFTLHRRNRLVVKASIAPSGTAWWSADHFQLHYAPLDADDEPDAIAAPSAPASTPAPAGQTLFTLDGRPARQPLTPGIYIVRQADGTSQKMVVR